MRLDRDYYAILGVKPDASPEQIRRRYRELARLHHPDMVWNRGSGHDTFVALTEAYDVLSDPVRRAAYDQRSVHGAAGRDQPAAGGPKASAAPSPAPGSRAPDPSASSAPTQARRAPRVLPAAACAAIGWIYAQALREPGPGLEGFWFLSQVPSRVFLLFLAATLAAGAALAASGWIGRFDEELFFFPDLPFAERRGPLPLLSLAIPLCALLSLYLGFAAYMVSVITLERASGSVLASFAAPLLLALAFGLPHPQALPQMLLWGAGIGYGAFVLGWLVGDVLRPIG